MGKSVSAASAKTRSGECLREVQRGNDVVITKYGPRVPDPWTHHAVDVVASGTARTLAHELTVMTANAKHLGRIYGLSLRPFKPGRNG